MANVKELHSITVEGGTQQIGVLVETILANQPDIIINCMSTCFMQRLNAVGQVEPVIVLVMIYSIPGGGKLEPEKFVKIQNNIVN